MSDVGCLMSDVGCRMSDVGCRMSNSRAVPNHKKSPKGRTELILSVFKATNCQQNDGDNHFRVAPLKPNKKAKRTTFRTENIR